MSDIRLCAVRLVEPLRHEPATDEQIAASLCEAHDVINGKPGDPDSAYTLADRVRAVVDRLEEDLKDAQENARFAPW